MTWCMINWYLLLINFLCCRYSWSGQKIVDEISSLWRNFKFYSTDRPLRLSNKIRFGTDKCECANMFLICLKAKDVLRLILKWCFQYDTKYKKMDSSFGNKTYGHKRPIFCFPKFIRILLKLNFIFTNKLMNLFIEVVEIWNILTVAKHLGLSQFGTS